MSSDHQDTANRRYGPSVVGYDIDAEQDIAIKRLQGKDLWDRGSDIGESTEHSHLVLIAR